MQKGFTMNIKAGAKFDRKLLKNPPLECEVTYGWIWNEPITREGIDERLEGFVKAGIKSLYILPLPKDFRPETLRTFLTPEYLTEDYWKLTDYAIRKCVKLGIKPWIYDEGGWPSGVAGLKTVRSNPAAVAKLLTKREIELKAGEGYTPCEDFIAIFDGKTRLDDSFVADKDMTVTEYYAETQPDNCYFIDFTDPTVTDTFIENTYEGYKKCVGDLFGDVIPLFFTDEPGLRYNTLPKGVFELFKEKYGYDLKDYAYVIPNLGEMAETDAEIKARQDFHKMLGELFVENTFDKISRWCEENNIYYSGHMMADNYPHAYRCGYYSILDVMKRTQLPGIDVIWEQIRLPYGGRVPYDADETWKMPFFPRLAQSAARQMGRNLALTETYSIYGEGISPDEMRYVSNYQVVRGINVFNFLNLPYGKSRCSALMMRPGFCPEKPGFYNLKHIHEYYARLSYLTRLGYAEGDTALYHPINDYITNPAIMDAAIESYRALGVELEDKNVSFDIIDDYAIRAAKIEDGGLKLGDAVYRHIAVPANKYMPEDVREKIAPYIGEGAPTYTFKNEKVRVMTRKLDTGRLWFIFNEGIDTVCEELDIAGGHKVYRIDVQSGDMYLDNSPMLDLVCGDIAVYYVTDEVYETVTDDVEYKVDITGLEAESYKQFLVEYEGITNKYGKGMPDLEKVFSGEITLRGYYELPESPKAKDRYRITLNGFSVSAMVKLGKYEATLGMSPMSVTVPGKYLKRKGEIEITVANTAADEIVAKRSVIYQHPLAEVGDMYQKKMAEFEEKAAKLSIGTATIEKLA